MHTPKYLKAHRRLCAPVHFHNKLLKHLSPQWQEGITHLRGLLHKNAEGDSTHIHIQHPDAMHATLPSGNNRKPSKPLQSALSILRELLFTLVTTEHHTLPKSIMTTNTQVHHSWLSHLPVDDIPPLPAPRFTQITTHTS